LAKSTCGHGFVLVMMITLVASQIKEKNMVEKYTIHPIIIIWASCWSMLLMKING
jgi:hypothetical protein